MFISIVVPLYNVPVDLLAPCLESLAKQTLRHFEYEIIIVDDASTDDECVSYARAFASKLINAKYFRHEKNKGLNDARKTGVASSSGTHIIFVDSDDILTRDALEALRIEAGKTEADIVTGGFYRWNSEDRTYNDVPITFVEFPDDMVERLSVALTQGSFTMCGRLFRREVLEGGTHDIPEGMLHEDVTTWIRALVKANKVRTLKKPIYYYTANIGSITKNFRRAHADGMIYSIKDWIKVSKEKNVYNKIIDQIDIGAQRMISVCVERCVFSPKVESSKKAEILEYLGKQYVGLGLPQEPFTSDGMRFLSVFMDSNKQGQPADLLRLLDDVYRTKVPAHMKPTPRLRYGLQPTPLAKELENQIVFIAQVDYHVRSAALLARSIRAAGFDVTILDNSAFVAKGSRRFILENEKSLIGDINYRSIPKGPYEADWLATAKLVICFNDYNDDFRAAIEFRNRLNRPSVCVVEGINDFARVDFEGYQALPYRRCDHVMLAGEYDRRYFRDRNTHVIGMPIIERLVSKKPVFPDEPRAVLNVNFTYGCLEDRRDEYVRAAADAFDRINVDWSITRHPMDKGTLFSSRISSKSQYELIDESSVFVSRFATGILEALASGKPVIYFNPHGEKVDKFKDPRGAFKIATTAEELVEALNLTFTEIKNGVDFRERAKPFLEFHCAYTPDRSTVSERFAEAVKDITRRHEQELIDTQASKPRIEIETPATRSIVNGSEGQEMANQVEGLTQAGHQSDQSTGEKKSRNRELGQQWYAPIGNSVRKHTPTLFPIVQRLRRISWKLISSPAIWIGALGSLSALASFYLISWPLLPRLAIAGAAIGAASIAALVLVAWRLRRYISQLSAQNRELFEKIEHMDMLTKGRDDWARQMADNHVILQRQYTQQQSRISAEIKRLRGQVSDASGNVEKRLLDRIALLESEHQRLVAENQAFLDNQIDEVHQRLNATLEEQSRIQQRTIEGDEQLENQVQELEKRITQGLVDGNETVQAQIGQWEQKLEAIRTHIDNQVGKAATDFNQRLANFEKSVDSNAKALAGTKGELEDSMKALRQGLEQRMHAEIDEYAKKNTAEIIDRIEAIENAQNESDATYRTQLEELKTALNEQLKPEIADVRQAAEAANKATAEIDKAVKTARAERIRLKERAQASERQIGALRYPEAPDVFVFFGHHKCASRFFRVEVFGRIAESMGARRRSYQIKDRPFHYSRMDELDLVNVDFEGLGQTGKDVVWFANATERGLEKIKRKADNWKGLRVIRDPRQVLISDYFHHKGDHPDVAEVGWVWDQLVKDKPILRELPEEDGILHELDNISKQVIEDQILAPFDDERVMTIRLEDFTEDPQAHLLKISEFLNVPDVAGINMGNTYSNPESGHWKKHFTSKIRERFKERYGQALIDLGYAEDMDW